MATQMDFGTNGFDYEIKERVVFGEGLRPGSMEWDMFHLKRQAEFNRWRSHLVIPIKEADAHESMQRGPLLNLYRAASRWIRFVLRP